MLDALDLYETDYLSFVKAMPCEIGPAPAESGHREAGL